MAESIDKNYLNILVEKAEDLINRKIRLLTIKSEEESSFLKNEACFLIWEGN